jgi:hypothetical protein
VQCHALMLAHVPGGIQQRRSISVMTAFSK